MKQRMAGFSLIGLMTLGIVCLMMAGTPHTIASGSALTPTPPPVSTRIPAGTSNSVWTPVERDFDGVTMVLVPAGCFWMGTPDDEVGALGKQYNTDRFNYESPVHEVCFSQPFWMDKTEVTNGQFAAMKGKAEYESNWTAAERPRERINWYEAALYCGARGARLPSEAEWEYTTRGPDSLVFPWGNEFVADNAVHDSNSEGETANVGSRPSGVSWVGTVDMSGNVYEWTNTIFDQDKFPYPYKANDGRESLDDIKSSRIVRGGSWRYSFEYNLRAAFRYGHAPDTRLMDFGFRCARSFDSEAPPTAPASTPAAVASTPIPAGTSNDVWMPIRRDFDGVTMVLVPPGCFMMGSTEEQIDYAFELAKESYGNDAKREWFGNERPAHEICFEQPFWIDQTEVTQAQFKQFGGEAAKAPYFRADNRPVEHITWFESKAFCEARGDRLPTEAEWEYAARGPEGLLYPWGNTFDRTRLNYCDANCEYDWKDKQNDDGYQYTAPVGNYLGGVSWVGALDMSGNVWEWLSSVYQPYPYKVHDGRESTLDTNSDRVLRGGGWFDFVSLLRAANRVRNSPDSGLNFIGFRCARSY